MEIDESSTIIDLVKRLDQPVDGVLVLSSGIPLPLDQQVGEVDGDEIELIAVASGG